MRRARRVRTDRHALDKRVRIALDLIAVHVRAGIAFVRVADDVLCIGLHLREGFHFVPVGQLAPPRPRSFAALTCSMMRSGWPSMSTLYRAS